jgi:hypothetical protein
VIDRGSYFRVLAPGRCILTRQSVEMRMGTEFRISTGLEQIMPSFQGALTLSEEKAEWQEPAP